MVCICVTKKNQQRLTDYFNVNNITHSSSLLQIFGPSSSSDESSPSKSAKQVSSTTIKINIEIIPFFIFTFKFTHYIL